MVSYSELISVIIPAHRDDNLLAEAMNSILNQTYENIEILLLDNSIQGISKSRFTDPRVMVKRTKPEWSLSKVLNVGIELSKGKFIARMDADDIAAPTRIEKQAKFLEINHQIGVLGTAVTILSEVSKGKWENGSVLRQPQSHDEISKKMFIKNPFFHPTVMLRRSVLPNNPYNEKYIRAQDYRLWVKLYGKTNFANLSESLLTYRFHQLQVGNIERSTSQNFAEKARFMLGLKSVFTNDVNQQLGISAVKRYIKHELKNPWYRANEY